MLSDAPSLRNAKFCGWRGRVRSTALETPKNPNIGYIGIVSMVLGRCPNTFFKERHDVILGEPVHSFIHLMIQMLCDLTCRSLSMDGSLVHIGLCRILLPSTVSIHSLSALSMMSWLPRSKLDQLHRTLAVHHSPGASSPDCS